MYYYEMSRQQFASTSNLQPETSDLSTLPKKAKVQTLLKPIAVVCHWRCRRDVCNTKMKYTKWNWSGIIHRISVHSYARSLEYSYSHSCLGLWLRLNPRQFHASQFVIVSWLDFGALRQKQEVKTSAVPDADADADADAVSVLLLFVAFSPVLKWYKGL